MTLILFCSLFVSPLGKQTKNKKASHETSKDSPLALLSIFINFIAQDLMFQVWNIRSCQLPEACLLASYKNPAMLDSGSLTMDKNEMSGPF
jgi:hypothetical protein